LDVLELLPIDYMGVEVDAQPIERLRDVAHCNFGVPPIVQMYGQWSQTQFRGLIGDKRTIHPSAYSNHTIVTPATPVTLDLRYNFAQLASRFLAGIQIPLDGPVVIMAMATDSVFIKGDLGVRRIHHTARADADFGQKR
jgi:hypothetical protein